MKATVSCGNKAVECHWELHWFSDVPVVGFVYSISQKFPPIKLALSPIRQLVGYLQNISATILPFGISYADHNRALYLARTIGCFSTFKAYL